jgi:hypothetical protein
MADEPEVPPEGDPPADPPKEGDPPAPTTISLEALPEDLRDRPEAEIKFLLEHMVNTLGSRNNQVDELKDQIAELRGAVLAPPPAEPDPNDAKPMEELILEDVDAALDRWAAKRGYVKGMGELSERVGEAEFSMVSGGLPDFAEHEPQIRKLLKEGNLPANRQNIMGAYTMAVGNAVLEGRARDARADAGGIPPSNTPPPPPSGDEPTMSELETEVARAHGITDPKEWMKYRDGVGLDELKLPT